MIYFSILIAISVVFVYLQAKKRQTAKLLESLKKHEADFVQANSEFEALQKAAWYISDRQYRQWKEKYVYLSETIAPKCLKFKTDDPIKNIAATFVEYFSHGRKNHINPFNEAFIECETPNIKRILDAKEIKNNSDQLVAIASDEDNTLLVAGAGTGKTTTILGKLAYLLERAHIAPEEILLLSFTGKAVEELANRISQKFAGLPIKVQTFHSFGLSVIGKALGKKPELAFSASRDKKIFLDEKFTQLLKDRAYLSLAVQYFAYYLKPVILEPGFFNLDDYYKYVKTEQYLTLKKEFVKSQQEVMIANFLYLNGIEYFYEMPYKHETATAEYKQYKPDFFLPDYDIYLEHFGVNRDGETKFTSNEAQNMASSERYSEEMQWKRDLHQKYKTTLIETFSYEFTEKNWQQLLVEKLDSRGVRRTQIGMGEVFSSLATETDVKKIVDLFAIFLDLSKSNDYSLQKLKEKVAVRGNVREQAFFELFAPIYSEYEAYLEKNGLIDFHDMLIRAAQYVQEGKASVKLKYIIIDEFQDFSMSKYHLVKALCDKNPEAKLFCVGDDWQSIFRFTGSDISLMTKFEENYGFTKKNQLVISNRFNDRLAVVSNRFILKNPQQINKEVTAHKHMSSEAVKIFSSKSYDDADHLLREILQTINREVLRMKKNASVFVLGRYNHNKPHNFATYQKEYKNFTLDFLTIHSAKGSEADYVIIVDMISGKYGFPSGVADDPLLGIVLSEGESYPHAEERRLMYVAMTRARHKVYIITEDHHKSVFVLELEGSNHTEEELVYCAKCGGEMTKRKGPYSHFYGCTNFPRCKYTKTIE
jgi:DNA helicase-4